MRRFTNLPQSGRSPRADPRAVAGFWGFGVVLLFAPGLARAYIDPGTGAYAIQLLVALFGALVFFATHPVRFMKEFIRGLRERLRRKAQ